MRALDAWVAQIADEAWVVGEALDPPVDVPARDVALLELRCSPQRLEVGMNFVSLDEWRDVTQGESARFPVP